ncbi:MAG: hypothetical protein N3G78_04820 [Desulfobacterota bacterium]|nr:hypothetical protein [Thermodesulfobacteriota bacterium]
MEANHVVTLPRIKEEPQRIEINPKRVAEWTLIFTNAFYIAYFFGRLLKII